jgi:drug/metabolite transporter (DMT)-like permease
MVAQHGGRCRRAAAVLSMSSSNGSVRPGNVPLRGNVTIQPPAGIHCFFHQLGPALMTAVMFTTVDICGKVALTSGTDVTSMLSFRSVIGVGLVFAWLQLSKPAALSPRATWISLGLGVMLTANMYLLLKAIELVPVSIAILTYFIYPLLTGILGAMTGIDRLTVTGAAIALTAFFGLAMIIGADTADLAVAGLAAAVGGALCRAAMLLITRATLKGADARVVTWYTMCSSTLGFFALSLLAWSWHWPQSAVGWMAFIGIALAVPVGVFALYVSTERIGPFRTALFMNLEPLMTSALGALLLGERLTVVQILGGVTMIGALCIFQMWR